MAPQGTINSLTTEADQRSKV